MGWKLRDKLKHRLAEFGTVFGITLTLDPKNFSGGPDEAYKHVMGRFLLSRFAAELARRGYIRKGSYFWVVEIQEQTTKMPHWHMVVDLMPEHAARGIPFGVLVEIWSSFRPKEWPAVEKVTAENYKGREPAFGSVRFSAPTTEHERACFYLSKYFVKWPANGYPDWIFDHVGRIPKYGHSKGFFPRESNHDHDCFCEVCRGEAVPEKLVKPPAASAKTEGEEPAKLRRQQRRTVGERVRDCGQAVTVVETIMWRAPDGTHERGLDKFGGKLPFSWIEVQDLLQVPAGEKFDGEITNDELVYLFKVAYAREAGQSDPPPFVPGVIDDF